jgi:hypothetical protein
MHSFRWLESVFDSLFACFGVCFVVIALYVKLTLSSRFRGHVWGVTANGRSETLDFIPVLYDMM